jgi:hypothetical protein
MHASSKMPCLNCIICTAAPYRRPTSVAKQTQQSNFAKTDVFSHIEVMDGRIWLRPEGTKYFCGDLPEQEQTLVWATQGVPNRALPDAELDGFVDALARRIASFDRRAIAAAKNLVNQVSLPNVPSCCHGRDHIGDTTGIVRNHN